jgi:hypothetical protein
MTTGGQEVSENIARAPASVRSEVAGEADLPAANSTRYPYPVSGLLASLSSSVDWSCPSPRRCVFEGKAMKHATHPGTMRAVATCRTKERVLRSDAKAATSRYKIRDTGAMNVTATQNNAKTRTALE